MLNLWVEDVVETGPSLNFKVSHSPVLLCVVKEKSSQKRGAH